MSSNAGLSLTIPVHNGELNPSHQQRLAISAYLATCDGKAVVVKLSRPTTVRSLNQNRLYWGVVLTTLADHTGHTTEELHEIFKSLFLPREFARIGSIEVEVRRSTTKLTTEEFTQYLEQLKAWADHELGVTIPDTN